MVGREVGDIFPTVNHAQGEIVFEVNKISVEDPNVPRKMLVDDVSFSVRRGEVLGIAGLMGAGRSDLLMAIFGAHAGRVTGDVKIDGKSVRISQSGGSNQARNWFCHRGQETLRFTPRAVNIK